MPVSNGDRDLLGRHVAGLHRPEQHEQLLAEKALHAGLVRAPAAARLPLRLETSIELSARLGRDDIPDVARDLASKHGLGSPLRLAIGREAAEHLKHLRLRLAALRQAHEVAMLLVDVGAVEVGGRGLHGLQSCFQSTRSKSSPLASQKLVRSRPDGNAIWYNVSLTAGCGASSSLASSFTLLSSSAAGTPTSRPSRKDRKSPSDRCPFNSTAPPRTLASGILARRSRAEKAAAVSFGSKRETSRTGASGFSGTLRVVPPPPPAGPSSRPPPNGAVSS